MLLTTQAIEEKALQIYQQSIKDRRIPEDSTSEIYYLFIKRMTAYKKRHPGITEVTSSFVRSTIRFILRDLQKREQRQQNKEEELFLVKQSLNIARVFGIIRLILITKYRVIGIFIVRGYVNTSFCYM